MHGTYIEILPLGKIKVFWVFFILVHGSWIQVPQLTSSNCVQYFAVGPIPAAAVLASPQAEQIYEELGPPDA